VLPASPHLLLCALTQAVAARRGAGALQVCAGVVVVAAARSRVRWRWSRVVVPGASLGGVSALLAVSLLFVTGGGHGAHEAGEGGDAADDAGWPLVSILGGPNI
jgi:hypothetical protein